MTNTVSHTAAERAAPAGRSEPARRPQPVRRIDRRPGLPGGRAVVGALLMVVAAVGVFLAYTDATGDPSTSFVVAATDLRPGDRIASQDLELTPIDLPASVSGRAFVSPEDLAGRIVLAPVAEGEVLQASAVTDQPAAEAGTEVAITLPRENVATGRLEVGDRVDVFQTTEAGTSTVARGVQVIDLTVSDSDDLGAEGDVEVVVTIPADDDVGELVHALRVADITIVRSTFAEPSDEQISFTPDAGGSGVEAAEG
jgi:hypothetical protein